MQADDSDDDPHQAITTCPSKKPPTVRAPGNGRKARRKRRLQAKQRGDTGLLQAPFLHGNTQPGRLALVDKAWTIWMMQHHHHHNKSMVFVDVGMGNHPETTLEWKTAIEQWLLTTATEQPQPDTTHERTYLLVGTEIDEERLQHAKDFDFYANNNNNSSCCANANHTTAKIPVVFEWSGTDFQLPTIAKHYNVRTIRAMNVTRDYHIHDACTALHRWYSSSSRQQPQQPGPNHTMILEGSTNDTGSIAVAIIMEQAANNTGNKGNNSTERIAIDGVVFGVDIESIVWADDASQHNNRTEGATILPGKSSPPQWFQRTFPRLWRHCFDDDGHEQCNQPWVHSMHQFLSKWQHVSSSSSSTDAKQIWLRSIHKLGVHYDLCLDGIHSGVLIWRNPVDLYVPTPAESLAGKGCQREDNVPAP
ncbi:hypothetical protein SEMRO_167_G074470.1 [Seminavis robusta]|uniref:Uncharacterized protein n=1 Tax=Seminavis robusta TaxID=568900 RepID=A0A9N8H8Q8_9STRA|nr:hypothetical protein SEMRO_167_G074470.1 [Seminavis robusta]|eukprot:Sro167_g074470.1 n/a (420) ;mRNA; r:45749-47008